MSKTYASSDPPMLRLKNLLDRLAYLAAHVKTDAEIKQEIRRAQEALAEWDNCPPPTQPPRRPDNRYDLFTPAEKAIFDCVAVVERAGNDVLLTDAVNLLHAARAKVYEFYEGPISVTREELERFDDSTFRTPLVPGPLVPCEGIPRKGR